MTTIDARSYPILASLIDQPRHGYAILKQIELLFPSTKRPAVATLYATLDRLEAEELVAIFSEEIVDGRARRTFALTDAGHAGVMTETRRLAEAVTVVQAQLDSVKRSKNRGRPAAKVGMRHAFVGTRRKEVPA